MADQTTQVASLSAAKRALLQRRLAQKGAAPKLAARSDQSEAPLSYAQQRFWFLQQLSPESSLYNVPRFVKLTGSLDIALLEQSLRAIVRRHQVLRCSYHMEEAGLRQHIHDEVELSLRVTDLRGTETAESVAELALEEYRRPFDLSRAPMLRCSLWLVQPQEAYLLLTMHHIASDGWTGGVLFDELGKHYRAARTGTAVELSPLPIQYADYAAWQTQLVEGSLQSQVEFWSKALHAPPPLLPLPYDHETPDGASYRGQVAGCQLQPQTAARLNQLARSQGMTLLPVLLAALRALLHQWTGVNDFVVGTLSANRSHTEIEPLIGCFMNFLALRGQVTAQMTAASLLATEKQTVLDAFANQELPFDHVVAAVNPERSLSANPLFNVALLLQNYPEFAFQADGLRASFEPLDTQVAFLDLRFLVTETSSGVLIECESNAERFEASTGDMLLQSYVALLEQIVANPDSTVGALALPDALQRHTLLRAQLQRPLCVAASYTADPILEPLRFWTKALGLRSEIQFAPFGQVYQQLLDPTGLLGRNRGGTNLLLLRAEDLLAPSDKDGSIEAAASQLVDALHTASAYAPLLVFFTPASSAVAATPAAMERCITLERTVMSRVENLPGLAAWSSATLQALYPVEMYEDTYAWQVGKIPYTSSMFAAMATFVARKLYNTHRSQRDVVLVAGEGRLWGCAATDPKLVRVLLEQAQRGILLTACDTQVSTPDGTPPSIASEELSWDYFSSAQFGMSPEQALQQISNELAIPPTRFLVLETDAKRCVRLEQQFAGLATVNMTMDQSWEDSWLLDPAVTLATLPFPQESKVQRRIQTELRTLDAIVEAVAHDRTPGSNEGNALQHIAPRTATETIVAAIWSQVLRQPQPSVDSNFFRLGGNSLLGVQVLSRIRQEASVELPLRAIFEAPTIAALAQRIDTLQRASASSLLPPLVAQSRPERTPASYAQQRLWFIDQLEPGNPIYNIPQRMRLRGPLDTLALQRSLSAVVHRHESLRTTFESDEGELAQVVNPARPVPLPVTDLSALTSPQLEEEAERYAQAEARQPFDLTRDLMLRAHLLRLAPQEHILLVVLHHIAGDRWSAGLLAEELEHLYAAYVQGTEPRLPELQVQYADYALWQRSWLHGEAMARQAAYWKEALAGAPALLELPTDKPRPATLQHAGGVTSIHLPPSLIEALNAVSVAHETTLFMTMLAALHVLLGRYARQDDVVIGTPIAGRNTTAAESMIGFFVNTLALRGTLGGNPSFSELLQRTRETVLNAYANQDVPFERVVEEVQPERSLSYQPLFQVMFALQNAPQQALQLAGLSLHREPLHQGTSAYDLSWFAIQVEDGMVLRLEFATSLFEQATIERMLRHYEVILLAAATAPSTRILELPLLPPSEQEWLRAVSNGPEITLPAVTSLHSMVEQQAARTPNAIACIDGTQSWSYRELNERANRIAHSLIQRGAGSEVLIGVYCERGFTLLVSILGVLKSGSAYVPLDPMYPQERIANILQDAKAPLVVTQQRLAAQLPHFAGELFFVDDDYNYQTQPNDNPKSGVQPENLAYVLFTSGSTGRPKGVALEHRSAIVFVVWALGVFTQRELAGVLFSTSVCFDLSVFEMFVPLSAGGTVILVENALHLPQLPARHQVTLINTVPSAIAELLRVEGVPATTLTVNLAGEALPDDLVEKIYTTTAVERVYNLYGPTEDTTYSTYTLVQRGELVTIGKPLAGTQAYVLDEQLAPVPIGVPGELYLAGAGLARGYYGRGDLTAERFLRVPASLATAGRMYKTSDLCRWLPDGRLQYLGRADHQVKIRGYRIELGEVELAMQQHPTIAQCVAVAREDNETKRLVAYVTVREAGVDANELRDSVRRTLPDYMVPAAVVILDSFPLTPNGKIDRKRLPAPEFGSSAAQAFVAPRNDMEATLASIWQEVLQLSSVSIHDNFFDIGGHSLLATRFLSRLRKQFAIDLPLLTLFESATIAELAREVQSRVADTNAVDEITPVERTAGLPLSFAQQRMWFLEQLVPGTPVHNIPNALRLRNALDVQSLRTALRMVLTRQEALRSTFSSHQGRPSVTVLQEAEPWLEWIDLTSHPEEDRWQLALQRVEQQAQTPIDLQHGPLLRTLVVSLGPHDHIVLFNIHHIVSDRWSISILVREVLSAYVALSSATPPVLPPLPSQYVDYAAWQQCFASTPDFEQQLHYWLAELKDAPPLLELPTDRPRTATNAPVGGEVRFSLSPALTDALHRLSQVSGATLFMTLLTGFQVLLARHSGQDDVVTGVPAASRTRAEVEGLIGLFVNTLPIRYRATETLSFHDALQQTRIRVLEGFARQDVPFERIVEELHPERSLSYDPVTQVYFVLQNAPNEGLDIEGLMIEHIETSSGTVKGDLYLSMSERDGGLRGRLEYNAALFDPSTMQRFVEHFEVLLTAAAASPHSLVAQLPLLTQEERATLLHTWNATETAYDRAVCVHHLFEAQAQQQPDAVACVCGDESITYRELDLRSTRVARALRQQGLGRGSFVGLFLDRSLSMMVCLLGVMKSGAAYVPLDPAYPADRTQFILEDAQIGALVTHRHYADRFAQLSAPVFAVEDLTTTDAQGLPDIPLPRGAASDLVYVIFTSGSTGRPKGVQIPHGAVVNLLLAMQRLLQTGHGDVFPALASYAFDMCIPELYLALVSGGTTLIAPQNMAANGEELAELLLRKRATVVHATPTTWQLLLQAGFSGAGLKRAIGAEPLPLDLCTRLLQADPSLYNFYGPTETTVWSAVHHFTHPGEPVVLGKPLANTQIYILDAHLQPLPIGVRGEIYIGGDGVAHGYLNRPELSAERFLPDPFNQLSDRRIYRTGDLGRFLADGSIEFLGRSDFQIKLRGYRIELTEIENVMSTEPNVLECAVALASLSEHDKRLVGYVVYRQPAGDALEQVKQWARERVPEYMVPTVWVELERLPRSPNGKVNRNALPQPVVVATEPGSAAAMQTEMEQLVADVWIEVLRLPSVQRDDDFFALGGHSLLATQVVSRLRERLDVSFPLRLLFESPVLHELAQQLQGLAGQPAQTGIERADRTRPIPLSFAQQRLWFMDQLEPENPLYNVAYAARLYGPLRLDLVERSLQEIVKRHESLRTTFSAHNDEPVQQIHPSIELPFQVTDLTMLPEEDRLEQARALARAAVRTPFQLSRGPLIRVHLFHLAEEENALVINTHHIISDRWSLGVLSRELVALYTAMEEGLPSPLPELTIQYADFSVWQRERLSGAMLESELAYWRHALAGAPFQLRLPYDFARQQNDASWGVFYRDELAHDLAPQLRTLSRDNGATFYMTLLAAFYVLLGAASNQDEMLVGTDLANRTEVALESLIGFFVNLLPMRARLQPEQTFTQFLAQVRATAIDAFAHQEMPFDRLVEELQPERSSGQHPLVQVLFVMQNTPDIHIDFGSIRMGPLGVTSSSRFDLVLFLNNPDGEPNATWLYNPSLFKQSTIEKLARTYQQILRAICEQPEATIRNLLSHAGRVAAEGRADELKDYQSAGIRKLKEMRRKATPAS